MTVYALYFILLGAQVGMVVWWTTFSRRRRIALLSSCRWAWEVIAVDWIEDEMNSKELVRHEELRTAMRKVKGDQKGAVRLSEKITRRVGMCNSSIHRTTESLLRARLHRAHAQLHLQECLPAPPKKTYKVIDPAELETLDTENNIVALGFPVYAEG
jgi:hypothetical protein